MSSQKEKQSAELAGFAPAARGGGATKAASNGVSSAPAAPASVATPATDGNIDSASRTSKKKAAATKPAVTKKRAKTSKAVGAGGSSAKDDGSSNGNEATTIEPIDPSKLNSSSFQPIPLPQIQLRIKLLLDKLPSTLPEVPPDYINPDNNNNHSIQNGDPNTIHYPPIRSFANLLQTAIEEYNLLLSLVSAATYQWGVDRSGASQQNLTVMNSELQQCQDVIANVISGRLSNVLCPAVDILVGKVEIVRGGGSIVDENGGGASKKRKLDASSVDDGDAMKDRLDVSNQNQRATSERRINHYTRPLVDPSYVHLCHQIVARNSEMLRYTLATCIHTAQKVIADYMKAMKKDVGHEANKGGYY